MYKVAKMTLELKTVKVSKIEDIDWLLTIMYRNGLILDNYIVKEKDGELFAYVTTTDDDSLNEKHYNSYVKKELKRVEIKKIEIIGDDALATDSCHCCEYDELYLVNDEYGSSPVYCGKCGKEIPLVLACSCIDKHSKK